MFVTTNHLLDMVYDCTLTLISILANRETWLNIAILTIIVLSCFMIIWLSIGHHYHICIYNHYNHDNDDHHWYYDVFLCYHYLYWWVLFSLYSDILQSLPSSLQQIKTNPMNIQRLGVSQEEKNTLPANNQPIRLPLLPLLLLSIWLPTSNEQLPGPSRLLVFLQSLRSCFRQICPHNIEGIHVASNLRLSFWRLLSEFQEL